jgi:hypothetical protein
MSVLSERYNIPESTLKKMITDGFITTCVARQDEILYTYKAYINKGMSDIEARKNTSITHNCSDRWVYELVKRFY